MINQSYENEKTNREDLYVSYDQLQEYLLTIDETNEIYTRSAIAKLAGFPDISLPSTYPALFWQEFTLPWLNDKQLILSGQKFNYIQPLYINKAYQGQITLERLRLHNNKQFATHKLEIFDLETLVATVETTLVIIGEN